MNSDEALAVVEAVLSDNRLNKLQKPFSAKPGRNSPISDRPLAWLRSWLRQANGFPTLATALPSPQRKSHQTQRPNTSSNKKLPFSSFPPPPPPASPSSLPAKTDWGEAVDAPVFFGRTSELATLSQWIAHDRCRLIGLFGMGGIGKTSLSVRLAKHFTYPPDVAPSAFEWVVWRSLRNAPPLARSAGRPDSDPLRPIQN
ncbi:MAG: hypothetical protein HC881_07205 [Leptolyngbyaceae cyanobacterium SL_7_1]|nr:hypothetical protein [Leptolyngbyaceae cyanobacterium SL_7_1]